MKVIDAFWEKRNLGVTCYELEIGENDRIEELRLTYEALKEREYMVAKIPPTNFQAVQFFQQQGYTFIEAAITMTCSLCEMIVPAKVKPIVDRCSWQPMNNQDLEDAIAEIGKGVFQTDRIYLDPAFTKEQAIRRYQLWLRDDMKDNSTFGYQSYKVLYEGKTIGFSNRHLSAAYSEYAGTGMGFCVLYAVAAISKEIGVKKSTVHVSSNNINAIRGYGTLGYRTDNIVYVFVKHPFKQGEA